MAWNPQHESELCVLDRHGMWLCDVASDSLPGSQVLTPTRRRISASETSLLAESAAGTWAVLSSSIAVTLMQQSCFLSEESCACSPVHSRPEDSWGITSPTT